jgi:hypothetical protein
LKSGGCATSKKAAGGAVGKAERQAEHELKAMHDKKDIHEAMKRGGHARDPGMQRDLPAGSAEGSDVYVEGLKSSHRIPKKRGGAIGKPMHVNVDLSKHLHVHPGGLQMAASALNAAGQPPMAPVAGPPPGPAAGLPAGLPMRARGGHIKAGAFTGIARIQQAEDAKRRE